jgi:nucleoid-associated protein YgaU
MHTNESKWREMVASSSPGRAARGAMLAVAALAGAGSLWFCRPGAMLDGSGPDAAIVAAAAWLAWLLAGYLALTVAVTAAVAARGPVRLRAGALSAAVSPRVVRRAVEALVGFGVAAALVGPMPVQALADSPHPGPASRAPAKPFSLDWPGLADPDRPPAARPPLVAAPPRDARPPREARPVGGRTVVVRPGDSLWAIARRDVGPSATATQVAAEWPRWWTANRRVIGRNPDVIRPGQRLVPPTEQRSRS